MLNKYFLIIVSACLFMIACDQCNQIPGDELSDLACDPVQQERCAEGEKCAFILDDPETGEGHTDCTPDGDVPLGEACVAPTMAGDSDNCAQKGHCYTEICREISPNVITGDGRHVPNACGVDGTGRTLSNSKLDFTLCLPTCDLLTQDCADKEGCYPIVHEYPVCIEEGQSIESCRVSSECQRGYICYDRQCRALCGSVGACTSDNGLPNACGCGDKRACPDDSVCISPSGILNNEDVDVGICRVAKEISNCDCAETPVCEINNELPSL